MREATTKNEGFILGDEELKEDHEKIFFVGGSSVLCNGIDISKRFPYYSSKLMRENNYRGYISLEFEGNEDANTAIPKSLKILRDSFYYKLS